MVLGLVALGAFVATSIAGVVLGGIQGSIIDDTQWSRASIGLAAGLGVWGTGISGPMIGRLVDRYGARKLMVPGTLILGVCLFSMIWVHSLWQFFLIAIVARIISQPILIGVVPRTVAVNFFRRRRNIALAVISVFRPFSGAVNIQLFAVLATAYGWRATFGFLGVFSLALTVPMALLIRRRPEDIGLLPDGEASYDDGSDQAAEPGPPERSPSETGTTESGTTESGTTESGPGGSGQSTGGPNPGQTHPTLVAQPEVSWTAREALRTRAYWMVAFSAFLATTAHTSIGFSLVPYLSQAASISNTQAAGVLSISTALVLSNLGWGWVAGKVGPRVCIFASTALAIVLIIYLFTVQSIFEAYLFGVLWGLGTSATEVLISILLARYYGRNSYGSIAGAMRPFEASGLGIGSILGGLIYDLTGSYDGLFYESIVASVLALGLITLAKAPVRPVAATPSSA